MSSTSNLERFGPAIAPTATNRIMAAKPAAAAEGVNPPKAKVSRRFIGKKPKLGIDIVDEPTNLQAKVHRIMLHLLI